ncbi:oligopeptide/dipeptide ABC transporter ATP-binding protein [Streptomyces sp. NPDC052042]|uniref:oligopeptide/dipeptide ABC transporter ATP-binding protein n=1 Tax=Streptomyces sp. NPDC052042 TaxID=3365683 RepID=UPI0037CE8EB6
MTAPATQPVLVAEHLIKRYPVKDRRGAKLTALAGASLTVGAGKTTAIVGESGSGKTTFGRAVMRLTSVDEGKLLFEGEDITHASERALRAGFRRRAAMVFQNPGTSLSPHLRVEDILAEPLRVSRTDRGGRRDRVYTMLEQVGLPSGTGQRYAEELSGGQRQRVGIARALMLHPRLVVADEPTASLDVSVQAQIINLLTDLRAELGLSYLFITHDLVLAEQFADQVAIMFLGEVVETGTPAVLSCGAQHPYTVMLTSMNRPRDQRIQPKGEPPSPVHRPTGCVFAPRCPLAVDLCRAEAPPLKPVPAGGTVACHRPGELRMEAA